MQSILDENYKIIINHSDEVGDVAEGRSLHFSFRSKNFEKFAHAAFKLKSSDSFFEREICVLYFFTVYAKLY